MGVGVEERGPTPRRSPHGLPHHTGLPDELAPVADLVALFGRTQVWNGSATVYVYRDDPYKRVRSYRRALRQAKAANRGIWGSC